MDKFRLRHLSMTFSEENSLEILFATGPQFFRETCMPNLTQPEGFVTGMAAKMFTVAGPVIVFGTLASVIYGVILMLFGLA